jgi:hypothetical protein
MNREPASTVSSVLLVLILAAAPRTGHAEVIEMRKLEERITVDDLQSLVVVVENVFGSIRVEGRPEALIELTADETIRADTGADLARARSEVTLRTEREAGRIAFVVTRLDESCACPCMCRWDDYVVQYDIVLHIPLAASIDLETVNGGEIVVDDVAGDFEVRNVNGSIMLRNLRGSGKARTVNGGLTASFADAPRADTMFATVNGDIEVAYPEDLGADLRFGTLNGEVWTDFEATPLPTMPVSSGARTNDGRFTIRSNRPGVRIGSGGPTHTFDTLNGDVYVRRVR